MVRRLSTWWRGMTIWVLVLSGAVCLFFSINALLSWRQEGWTWATQFRLGVIPLAVLGTLVSVQAARWLDRVLQ